MHEEKLSLSCVDIFFINNKKKLLDFFLMISFWGEGVLLQFYGGKCKNQSQVHDLVFCGYPWNRTEYQLKYFFGGYTCEILSTCRRFLSLFLPPQPPTLCGLQGCLSRRWLPQELHSSCPPATRGSLCWEDQSGSSLRLWRQEPRGKAGSLQMLVAK